MLRRAIGFERWCSLLVDPDTLLMSRGIGHNDWARELPRLNVEDAGTADVNSLAMLARSRDHAAVLRAATGGDLARSSRWREILSPYGVGDELRARPSTSTAAGATSCSSATATTGRSTPTTRS